MDDLNKKINRQKKAQMLSFSAETKIWLSKFVSDEAKDNFSSFLMYLREKNISMQFKPYDGSDRTLEYSLFTAETLISYKQQNWGDSITQMTLFMNRNDLTLEFRPYNAHERAIHNGDEVEW